MSLLPHTGRSRYRPVREDGRVVDLELVAVDGRVPPELRRGAASGGRLSVLLPDARVDGRLAALCAVAETGAPFRLTRPATRLQAEAVLSASRTPEGDVLVEVAPAEGAPLAGSRDERRWQRLVEEGPLGVAVVTLDGYVLEANRTLLRMLGRPEEGVVGVRLHDYAAPGDTTRLDRDLLVGTGTASMVKRYARPDGTVVELRITASLVEEDGEPRSLSVVEDITEARQAQAELARRADHDPLTGLPNRERLGTRLDALLAEVRAGERRGVGLLFLDLDRFKVINDSLGHAVGDRLLREVALRLQRHTPPGDLLARLGGDEFALVTSDPDAAVALARRLVDALDTSFVLDGREVTVGASVGVALRRAGTEPAGQDDLLRDADTAMYAAKRAGEGPVVVFEDTLRRRALARLEDEQGLRLALQRGELRVHYQPVLRLADLQVESVEALVRWQHPDRGLLSPGAFLATAEDTGLVVPLGRTVLRTACAQLARWQAAGSSLKVAVNIAAQHLASGTLLDDVGSALATAGLPAASLTLEITEQALVVSHRRAAADLEELRRRGCRIALDDFGTGYSSLAYLRRLPVDVLKIDRTFVTGAGAEQPSATAPGTDRQLLTAIARLGASLGLPTVLEGIETPAELEAARQAGATHVQGDLLGAPRPAAAGDRPPG